MNPRPLEDILHAINKSIISLSQTNFCMYYQSIKQNPIMSILLGGLVEIKIV